MRSNSLTTQRQVRRAFWQAWRDGAFQKNRELADGLAERGTL